MEPLHCSFVSVGIFCAFDCLLWLQGKCYGIPSIPSLHHLFMHLLLAVNEWRWYVFTSIHICQKEVLWTLSCAKTFFFFPWCYIVILSKDLRQFVKQSFKFMWNLWHMFLCCYSIYQDSKDVLDISFVYSQLHGFKFAFILLNVIFSRLLKVCYMLAWHFCTKTF